MPFQNALEEMQLLTCGFSVLPILQQGEKEDRNEQPGTNSISSGGKDERACYPAGMKTPQLL